jgi:protein TonB
MKKNRVFWGMLGLSAAFHGLAMIGMPGDTFHTLPPDQEYKIVSTLKVVKIGTPPPVNAPDNPQEKQVVEKPAEPLPEIPPVQEATPNEEIREDDDTQDDSIAAGNNEESPEGEAGENGIIEGVPEDRAEEGGTMEDREYETLLAYIREYIDKNLVYPPMARRRNIEGIVGISFEIETNGELVSVSVHGPSGSSILDNAAVSLVKKMHRPGNIAIKRKLAFKVNITYKLTE